MLEVGVAPVIPNILSPGDESVYKLLPSWSELDLQAERSTGEVSVSFSYPKNAPNSHMLYVGARIRIRFPFSQSGKLDKESTYMLEPPNMTFVIREREYIDDYGRDDMMKVSAKSLTANTEKLIMAPAIGSVYIDEELFTYTNVTPGELVLKALGEVLSRSPQTDIGVSFSATHDSQGKPWPFTIDASFNPGQSFKEVLDWLSTLGFAYSTMGFHRIWIPPQDTTTVQTAEQVTDMKSPTYRLHLYQDAPAGYGYYTYYLSDRNRIQLTNQEDFGEIVNSVFVTGNDSICTWVQRQDSINLYGVHEGQWSVSNAAEVSTLVQAGERYLDLYAHPRYSQTIDIEYPADGAIFFYFPKIQYTNSLFGETPHTIENVSLKVDSASSLGSVTLTLDNFFDKRKAILDQRLARLGLTK